MGRKSRNIAVDFDKLVKIFNEDGKEAAIEFVKEEYKSSYSLIQRRIKKETNYFFNKNTRKYEMKTDNGASFLTMEELCEGKSQPSTYIENHNLEGNIDIINDDFKGLILNLMKDKMQEISKYIYLEQSTNQVIINLKKLEDNGYRVIIN